MNLPLAYDWKRIVKRAWSIRLNMLSVVFIGAEVLLPIYTDRFPRHIFAVLSLVAVFGSMWARVIRQNSYFK